MSETAGSPQKPVRILVVEDSPTQLEKLRFLLEESGFSVVGATNGKHGLAAAKANAIDLVISDVVMPEMDGYALCTALRADEAFRHLPVILLTSLTDPWDVIKGLESGANNFICKPYDDHGLVSRVRNVITNREIRRASSSEMGISISFAGQSFFITADRLQILDLLLSTYEIAIQQNRELLSAREELEQTNRALQVEIAERKSTEKAVDLERQRLYDVLETLPAYVILLSADYHVPFANRFFRERFGESEGRRCYEYLFHRDTPCENCETFTVLKTAAPHYWEWIGPDGRSYDTFDYPFTDTDGAPLVLEMGIDITETKRAQAALTEANESLERRVAERTTELRLSEAALQNSLARSRAVTESAHDAIVTMDGMGTIVAWNLGAEQIFGVSELKAVGQPISIVIPERFRAQQVEDMKRLRNGADPRLVGKTVALSGTRADGTEFPLDLSLSRWESADGFFYTAIIRDTTERCRAEAALRAREERFRTDLGEQVDERTHELVEAREQAEAANKAKSAFLATMSHEIRTPLNGVIAMAEILALRPLRPRDLDSAKTIERSAHTLLAVIDDILDFSKIEAGKLELEVADMRLCDVAVDVLVLLRPVAAASDVDLAVDVAPSVPEFVRGDATRVRQILMNLVGNAIKFSRDRAQVRGAVSVHVDVASESPSRIALRVVDNGIGMAQATLDRLFTSFTQAETSTTRRFGGTGLGLAISKRLVELMKGTIEVTSEVGLGSTFTGTLPFQAAASRLGAVPKGHDTAPSSASADRGAVRPLVHAAPLSMAEARVQGRLILVAEDDSMNQKVVLQQLALLGYAGEIAGDGTVALRLWRLGTYAMLLCDLHMPNMDGYELVTALRSEEPPGTHLPIIALTANALRGEAERAAAAGMDAYVTKPVPLVTLRDVLEQWIVPAATTAVPPQTDISDSLGTASDRPVPILRVSVLKGQVGGDLDVVRAHLATYRHDARTLVALLQSNQGDGDLRKVGEHAAMLKAMSRAVGALLFGDLCAELENAATMGDEAALAQQMTRVAQTFSSVESELEQLLRRPEGTRGPS